MQSIKPLLVFLLLATTNIKIKSSTPHHDEPYFRVPSHYATSKPHPLHATLKAWRLLPDPDNANDIVRFTFELLGLPKNHTLQAAHIIGNQCILTMQHNNQPSSAKYAFNANFDLSLHLQSMIPDLSKNSRGHLYPKSNTLHLDLPYKPVEQNFENS